MRYNFIKQIMSGVGALAYRRVSLFLSGKSGFSFSDTTYCTPDVSSWSVALTQYSRLVVVPRVFVQPLTAIVPDALFKEPRCRALPWVAIVLRGIVEPLPNIVPETASQQPLAVIFNPFFCRYQVNDGRLLGDIRVYRDPVGREGGGPKACRYDVDDCVRRVRAARDEAVIR